MIKYLLSNVLKLSLDIKSINLIVIFICFFSMGFFIFKITLAMFCLYFLININRFSKYKLFKKECLLYFNFIFLIIFFYIVAKINGFYKEDFDVTEPLVVIIFCLFGGLIFLFSDYFQKKMIIISLIFGYGFYCSYTVFYNIYYLDVASVYANVYNPFTGSYENSPKFANFLIIFTVLILYLLKQSKNIFKKIIWFLFFIFIFQLGVFTGSRSFILINILLRQ